MKKDDKNSPSRNVRLSVFCLIGIVALALIAITGMRFSPPPIAHGISCDDLRDCGKANRAFTDILIHQFPLGSRADVLRSALVAQGFHALPSSITKCLPFGEEAPIGKLVIECPSWDPNWNPRNDLTYGWGLLPCGHALTVRWSVDKNGRLAHLEGAYDYVCL